jgi:hypothetical protein
MVQAANMIQTRKILAPRTTVERHGDDVGEVEEEAEEEEGEKAAQREEEDKEGEDSALAISFISRILPSCPPSVSARVTISSRSAAAEDVDGSEVAALDDPPPPRVDPPPRSDLLVSERGVVCLPSQEATQRRRLAIATKAARLRRGIL